MSAAALADRVAILEAAAAAADERIAAYERSLTAAFELAGRDPAKACESELHAVLAELVRITVSAYEAEGMPVPPGAALIPAPPRGGRLAGAGPEAGHQAPQRALA